MKLLPDFVLEILCPRDATRLDSYQFVIIQWIVSHEIISIDY